MFSVFYNSFDPNLKKLVRSMDPFVICIAGLTAQIYPLFLSTREYCKKYLINAHPELSIQVTSEDLLYEQRMLDIEAEEEGLKRRKFTDPFLERASIQRKLAEELLKRNVLMIHGSTVALDGEAYMFTASCGTGKSTHTRLWREAFGDRTQMVNDDKPFLEIKPDSVIAHGSPWSGKHGLDTNISVPLKGICVLHRGPENVIRQLYAEEAMEMLLHQSYLPETDWENGVTLLKQLAEIVPLWEMECTKDLEAAYVALRGMSGSII